jgi:hypothetical protein
VHSQVETAWTVVLTPPLFAVFDQTAGTFPLSAAARRTSAAAPAHEPADQSTYPCLYFAAITSLEFMSMVRVHPEVPLNSNGSGLVPRR